MSSRMVEGLADSEVTRIYLKVQEELEEEARKLGISEVPKPDYSSLDFIEIFEGGEPRIPYDLTSCTITLIGQLFSVCHSWLAYLVPLLALSQVDMKIWDENKEYYWAKIRKEQQGTKSDKDDVTRNNPQFVRVNARYILAFGKYELIKGKVKQWENIANLLSREITRRGGELDMARLEGYMSKRVEAVGKYLPKTKRIEEDTDPNTIFFKD